MAARINEDFTKRHKLGGMGNAVEPCELTPKQRKDWDTTRAAFLWQAPAFSHIFYSLMSTGDNMALFSRDEALPTMAVDGEHILINPDWFFDKPLNQRVFGLAHEVAHAMLDHCGTMHMLRARGKITHMGKSYPYHQMLMNVAMDLIINDMLIESKLGEMIPGGQHDKNMATAMDSCVDTYIKLYDEAEKNGGKGGAGNGAGRSGGFDQHLSPGAGKGKDPAQAQQQRNPHQWKAAAAAGAEAARVRGKLPASMQRFFGEIVEPKVPWQEKIQAFFARKVGSGSNDWRRPDRRLIVRDIYAPGRSGFGAGVVAVAIDTSASIQNTELDAFFAEMRGILEEVRPRLMLLMWCDAKLHRVDEITDAQDLHGIKPVGGGGTDFNPVFDYLAGNDIKPDTLVYLTDGEGTFPDKEPPYPVLWGSILERTKYPWGDVVFVPVKG